MEGVAAFVETAMRLASRGQDMLWRDRAVGELGGDFQGVQEPPRIAVRALDKLLQGGRVDGPAAELALERPVRQLGKGGGIQWAQDMDAGAGQERRVHLERWILRRGADEHHGAPFHMGQEGILLRLVEAVRLIDEEHRRNAGVGLCLGDGGAHVAHPGEHRREAGPTGAGGVGEELRQGRLAAARRPPQDHRCHPAGRRLAAERRVRPQEVALADELIQARRPHARGEGGVNRWRRGQ